MAVAEADGRYSFADVPQEEIERFLAAYRDGFDLFHVAHVMGRYDACGQPYFPDPFGDDVAELILDALERRAPFSAVRIADGETALLGYGRYPGTPALDRYAAHASIMMRFDRFLADEMWFSVLRDLMDLSVRSADVVGVCGLWRAGFDHDNTPELRIRQFHDQPRGMTGHWRAVDMLLRRAERGEAKGQVYASAHFYFGLARQIDRLVDAAERTLLITNKPYVTQMLRERHPARRIDMIAVGEKRQASDALATRPDFLARTEAALPDDLTGCLCLVGAGVWAEIYCTWIRARGGVAVDLGSGFDLMAGTLTRPVHRWVGEEVTASLGL